MQRGWMLFPLLALVLSFTACIEFATLETSPPQPTATPIPPTPTLAPPTPTLTPTSTLTPVPVIPTRTPTPTPIPPTATPTVVPSPSPRPPASTPASPAQPTATPSPTPTPTPEPTFTPTPTPTPEFPFKAEVKATYPNCGLTEIRGIVRDAKGAPLAGYRVKVGVVGGDWSALSLPSRPDGTYDVFLDTYAKAGRWYTYLVGAGGAQISYRLEVETTSTDCQPGGKGVQTVWVEFQAY